MHAEMKKNASRATRSRSSPAPAVTLAQAGAKKMTACVETTPTCLTGRMASTWSSRWRGAIRGPPSQDPPSVHHPRITVVLELEHVPGRIEQHERPVLFHQGLETRRDILVEGDLPGHGAGMQGVEVRRAAERHAEVPRVQAFRAGRRRALG